MRRRALRALGAAAAVMAAATLAPACTSSGQPSGQRSSPPARETPSGAASHPAAAPAGPCGTRDDPPRVYDHVVWIVFENHTYDDVIGSDQAAYLNHLAARCGLATRFFAETHPSLPNYIAMTSGSTHGITDDAGPGAHRLDGPSIFSQLAGDWRVLAESMPAPCTRVSSGEYAARHNPALYYRNLRGQCAQRDVPLRNPPDLSAAFTLIVPGLCHTMHSCEATTRRTQVRTGDRWLEQEMRLLLSSPQYRAGKTAIMITWDEGDGREQRIPTLVVSPYTPPGTRATARFDHYSLLRTTEDLLGLGHLGQAATARSMREAFGL